MNANETKRNAAHFLLYAFAFLLLWEWLRPLEQLTDTGYIWVFLLFLLFSLAMSFLGIKMAIGASVKIIYILYILNYLYFEGSFFSFQWIPLLIADSQENIGYLFEMDWQSLTDVFRSLLLFILLWLMTYLLHYWLIIRRKIFIFFFMTLVYVTVLDTFTPYAADTAIVRTVVSGFAIMGILNYYRLIEKEAISKGDNFSRKWMIPLAGMIAFSVLFGYASPKAEPIWPDPVPYIKSYSLKNNGNGKGSVQRIGYKTDDSRLGGPFLGDNQVVFRAQVESRHYWKVETKDVYTGKGWKASDDNPKRATIRQEEIVPLSSFAAGVKTEKETASLFFSKRYPHIVYPAGVQNIHASPNVSFEMDRNTEKIYSLKDGQAEPLTQYSLDYEIPTFSVSALMKTVSTDTSVMSEEFIQRYTQLPDKLPERVRELAIQITSGKKTWFEKARAVEDYFLRSPEFIYDQLNVPIPGEGDDYVDQFLFETRRGYCDNFSSSMTVLLRTLGIPARWVKGYTEGEFKELGEQNQRIFEITNNNAHSWVEVYFPNAGWVPFEPTKGFSGNVHLNFDTYKNNQTTREDTEQLEEPQDTPKPEKPDNKTNNKSSFLFSELWNKVKIFFKERWLEMFLVGVLLIAIVLGVFKKRARWLPYYLIWKYKRIDKDEQFAKAYSALLKQLELIGLKRKNGQTLREYARYVDTFFSSREMSKLTNRYEQFLYRGKLQTGSWDESKELWENLIKKTIA
ncbi:transglutaminase domain protein [Bacillus methanolicus PB1]|uniref:Transglutaminase domain protein n=1 Tax=Bacillus methanolicus PB1 TaxID=997296 RepID=I3E007_BACMT|nr:transglutaminase domain-containing protein [Bacillus methanolicus]EIJ79828.1 transglutaminase domain protein [Bacillus methanolicus PB1]